MKRDNKVTKRRGTKFKIKDQISQTKQQMNKLDQRMKAKRSIVISFNQIESGRNSVISIMIILVLSSILTYQLINAQAITKLAPRVQHPGASCPEGCPEMEKLVEPKRIKRLVASAGLAPVNKTLTALRASDKEPHPASEVIERSLQVAGPERHQLRKLLHRPRDLLSSLVPNSMLSKQLILKRPNEPMAHRLKRFHRKMHPSEQMAANLQAKPLNRPIGPQQMPFLVDQAQQVEASHHQPTHFRPPTIDEAIRGMQLAERQQPRSLAGHPVQPPGPHSSFLIESRPPEDAHSVLSDSRGPAAGDSIYESDMERELEQIDNLIKKELENRFVQPQLKPLPRPVQPNLLISYVRNDSLKPETVARPTNGWSPTQENNQSDPAPPGLSESPVVNLAPAASAMPEQDQADEWQHGGNQATKLLSYNFAGPRMMLPPRRKSSNANHNNGHNSAHQSQESNKHKIQAQDPFLPTALETIAQLRLNNNHNASQHNHHHHHHNHQPQWQHHPTNTTKLFQHTLNGTLNAGDRQEMSDKLISPAQTMGDQLLAKRLSDEPQQSSSQRTIDSRQLELASDSTPEPPRHTTGSLATSANIQQPDRQLDELLNQRLRPATESVLVIDNPSAPDDEHPMDSIEMEDGKETQDRQALDLLGDTLRRLRETRARIRQLQSELSASADLDQPLWLPLPSSGLEGYTESGRAVDFGSMNEARPNVTIRPSGSLVQNPSGEMQGSSMSPLAAPTLLVASSFGRAAKSKAPENLARDPIITTMATISTSSSTKSPAGSQQEQPTQRLGKAPIVGQSHPEENSNSSLTTAATMRSVVATAASSPVVELDKSRRVVESLASGGGLLSGLFGGLFHRTAPINKLERISMSANSSSFKQQAADSDANRQEHDLQHQQSTERLLHSLIGFCCSLAILCLVVVVLMVRCQASQPQSAADKTNRHLQQRQRQRRCRVNEAKSGTGSQEMIVSSASSSFSSATKEESGRRAPSESAHAAGSGSLFGGSLAFWRRQFAARLTGSEQRDRLRYMTDTKAATKTCHLGQPLVVGSKQYGHCDRLRDQLILDGARGNVSLLARKGAEFRLDLGSEQIEHIDLRQKHYANDKPRNKSADRVADGMPLPKFNKSCCHCVSCSESWLFRPTTNTSPNENPHQTTTADAKSLCSSGFYHPAPRGKLPFGAASSVNKLLMLQQATSGGARCPHTVDPSGQPVSQGKSPMGGTRLRMMSAICELGPLESSGPQRDPCGCPRCLSRESEGLSCTCNGSCQGEAESQQSDQTTGCCNCTGRLVRDAMRRSTDGSLDHRLARRHPAYGGLRQRAAFGSALALGAHQLEHQDHRLVGDAKRRTNCVELADELSSFSDAGSLSPNNNRAQGLRSQQNQSQEAEREQQAEELIRRCRCQDSAAGQCKAHDANITASSHLNSLLNHQLANGKHQVTGAKTSATLTKLTATSAKTILSPANDQQQQPEQQQQQSGHGKLGKHRIKVLARVREFDACSGKPKPPSSKEGEQQQQPPPPPDPPASLVAGTSRRHKDAHQHHNLTASDTNNNNNNSNNTIHLTAQTDSQAAAMDQQHQLKLPAS